MPATKKKDRRKFEWLLQELMPYLTPGNPGDLTYILNVIPVRLWNREKRWHVAAVIMGCMMGAFLCFFMRHVWPYELEKYKQNGEVE